MASKVSEFKIAFTKGLESGLKRVSKAVLEEGNHQISLNAIDTGSLLGSGEIVDESTLHKTVKWTAAHAKWVHGGTRPHWAPFKPILEWVKRNLAVTTFQGLTGVHRTYEFKARGGGARKVRATRKYTFHDKDGKAWSLMANPVHVEAARAVQAAIARRGTKAVPYARTAVQRVAPKASKIVAREVQLALRRRPRGGE